MPFNAPDLNVFRAELDGNISAIEKLKADSHATIKIQSLLNLTVYVLATRFLEGSVKHILYNCCKMRGDTGAQLEAVFNDLKSLNNPEFKNIKQKFISVINFDIIGGIAAGKFVARDISLLDQIVMNRHGNVHATPESSDWYNKNVKDLNDFGKEYLGLIKVVEYLDSLEYDRASGLFHH